MIVLRMRCGDPLITTFLFEFCNPKDVASALTHYLLRKGPLFSQRIQNLITAKNSGISTKTVALDALGLIFEEFYNTNELKLIHR